MIKAVIFDKDGTLFDYAAFWGPIVSRNALAGFSRFPLDEKKIDEMAYKFEVISGVDRNLVNHPNGILFRHDKIFGNVMRMVIASMKAGLNPFKVAKVLLNLMDHVSDDIDEDLKIAHFPDIRPIFQALKSRGIVIGIVTNDLTVSAMKFLKALKVDDLVDFLRCRDSGCLSKPNPEAIKELRKLYGLKGKEIAMVGDTKIDMIFGRRGHVGYRIAVLTGSGDEKLLRRHSDAVYPTILDITKDPVLFEKS